MVLVPFREPLRHAAMSKGGRVHPVEGHGVALARMQSVGDLYAQLRSRAIV